MISVQVRDPLGQWLDLPGGPFEVTAAELRRAREAFGREVAKAPALFGVDPASIAVGRAVLAIAAPTLDLGDRLALGLAVVTTHCRIADATGGPFERIP